MKISLPVLLLCTLMTLSCSNPRAADREQFLQRSDTPIARQQTEVLADTAVPPAPPVPEHASKKLRYMYAANGGLIGFFDDGSVSGCPRCDMIKENVATLYETSPHARYENHGRYLILQGTRMDFYEDSVLKHEWVLFDYKWAIKIFPRN